MFPLSSVGALVSGVPYQGRGLNLHLWGIWGLCILASVRLWWWSIDFDLWTGRYSLTQVITLRSLQRILSFHPPSFLPHWVAATLVPLDNQDQPLYCLFPGGMVVLKWPGKSVVSASTSLNHFVSLLKAPPAQVLWVLKSRTQRFEGKKQKCCESVRPVILNLQCAYRMNRGFY